MSEQDGLIPDTAVSGPCLEFDFPSLLIGVAQYAEGPTGTTVFRFPQKAVGAVDVRGGAPGAYNVDWLRLGYSWPNLDAIVISGGSWYGLAAAGGVAAALKEDGFRSGHWSNLATVAGAIVYDLGERRPNEIHPDEKLGAAAVRAARAGVFPQGAQGAGRMTMQGSYFGLWLHSGQGGAFRQVGPTKIACFSVVNSVGVIVDRNGKLSFGNQAVPEGEESVTELLRLIPENISTVSGSILGKRRQVSPSANNTTISVVVTNQRLDYAQLQRLAVQVHASIGRAIQPFATLNDGDVLFAASTCEVDNPALHPTDLGVVASEAMWDAILASVPNIPNDVALAQNLATVEGLTSIERSYSFGRELQVDIEATSTASLVLRNTSVRDIYGLKPGQTITAHTEDGRLFRTDHLFLSTVGLRSSGEKINLVLNPGPWEQVSRP